MRRHRLQLLGMVLGRFMSALAVAVGALGSARTSGGGETGGEDAWVAPAAAAAASGAIRVEREVHTKEFHMHLRSNIRRVSSVLKGETMVSSPVCPPAS